MWKKIFIVVAVIFVVFAAYRVWRLDDANAQVAADIRANPDGERARKTMLLTLADGRMYPVNYLREGNLVFMGIDGLWWREFVDGSQPVKMHIRGQQFAGQARTILDDPDYTEAVFARLRPTVPEWLPDWLNGKLVVITLDQTQPERSASD